MEVATLSNLVGLLAGLGVCASLTVWRHWRAQRAPTEREPRPAGASGLSEQLEASDAQVRRLAREADHLRLRLDAQTRSAITQPAVRHMMRTIRVPVPDPAQTQRLQELEQRLAASERREYALVKELSALRQMPPALPAALAERENELARLRVQLNLIEPLVAQQQQQLARVQAQLMRLHARALHVDTAALQRSGLSARGMDDLEVVVGIDLATAACLRQVGIQWLVELAETPVDRLQQIVAHGTPRGAPDHVTTWPAQAALAASNRWLELRELQMQLRAQRLPSSPDG